MRSILPVSPCLVAQAALIAASSLMSSLAYGRARCPEGSVVVAAGSFSMGSDLDEGGDDASPPRPITLTHDFCIDRLEWSVARYQGCVASGACNGVVPAFAAATMPMTDVAWWDARAACRSLGGRLPSDAEWERAARGVDGRRYPWGNYPPSCRLADFWTDGWGSCDGYGPSPVGAHPDGASPYGAQDLAGNVLEWVDDAYLDDASFEPPNADGARLSTVDEKAAEIDPTRDLPMARRHGVRGGDWSYDVVHSLRAWARDGYPTDTRDPTLGFRCAYDATDEPAR